MVEYASNKLCKVHFPIAVNDVSSVREDDNKIIHIESNSQASLQKNTMQDSTSFLKKLSPKGKTLQWKNVNMTIVSSQGYIFIDVFLYGKFSYLSSSQIKVLKEKFSTMRGVKQKKVNSLLSWEAVEVERVV